MTITTISDADLADALNVPREYVQTQCRARRWPHMRVGRRYRFTTAHVDAIAAAMTVAVETTPTSPGNEWGRKGRAS